MRCLRVLQKYEMVLRTAMVVVNTRRSCLLPAVGYVTVTPLTRPEVGTATSDDAGVVTLTPLGAEPRAGSCGPAVPGITIEVRDDEGRLVAKGRVRMQCLERGARVAGETVAIKPPSGG